MIALLLLVGAQARTCVSESPAVTYEFVRGTLTEEVSMGDPFGSAKLTWDDKAVMDWKEQFRCGLTGPNPACEGYVPFPLRLQTIEMGDRVSGVDPTGQTTTTWSETVRITRADGTPIRKKEVELKVKWECLETHTK